MAPHLADERIRGIGEACLNGWPSLRTIAFAAAFADGRIAAVAFAVHDGIACVNSVAADPEFHRRGYARKAISAVLSRAQDRCGATGACVPVVAANAPAVALYEGLGFRTEAYRYHYRRVRQGARI